MLKSACINPEIMKILSKLGHGDKILIADGNYPLEGKASPNSHKVYLGLTHGIPTTPQVLATLLKEIPVEKAEVMVPAMGRPEIFDEFQKLLGDVSLSTLGRFEFYDTSCLSDVKLAISTGEQRTFANILLTVGVVK